MICTVACMLACARAQDEDFEMQSSSEAPRKMYEVPAEERGPGAVDNQGKPYVREGEDEWEAQKRRLQEGAVRGHATPGRKKRKKKKSWLTLLGVCLLYTSPSPRDRTRSRMPSSA